MFLNTETYSFQDFVIFGTFHYKKIYFYVI